MPFSEEPKNECKDLDPTCRLFSDWKERQAISTYGNTDINDRVNPKVWLLGDQRRRNHTLRNVMLSAPVGLRQALSEESQAHRLALTQP